MTIEQKAQRYDEALERMKSWVRGEHPECFTEAQKAAEFIFPELKESEDELKWLTQFIQEETYNLSMDIRDDEDRIKLKNLQRSLAWLEKQGNTSNKATYTQEVEIGNGNIKGLVTEEIPIDKIEPKFKVGDWVSGYYTNYKVLSVNNDGYLVEDVDENKINVLFENEKFHHLWTVQDAKDGDVLVAGEVIFIFNKIHGVWINCHCSLHKDGSFNDEDYDLSNIKYSKEIHPATKEQRELLFQKMKEAGYEWDKKELKTILITPRFEIGDVLCDKSCTTLDKKSQPNFEIIDIRNDMYICDKCSFPIYQQDEYELVAKKIKQCSTWSEEDERICQCLIESQKESLNMVNNNKYSHSEIISDLKEMYSERINWLKSLKQRIGE